MRCLVVLMILLAACTERTEPYRTAPKPEAVGYRAGPVGTTAYANRDLADLFVRLTHGLESGRFRKSLQRFEAPVNVGFIGPGSDEHRPFLQSLLAEIRAETGIDITAGPAPHNLLVRMIPGEEFLPETNNQCVVLFGQPTWQEFDADPGRYSGRVTQEITAQEEMGVLIPDTIEPYKVRECLMEEITQALGTANDLYGLGPTIFNDDNAHSWPTRLDYLMLKVLYDPRLKSGMNQAETRRIARLILDEVHPEGRAAPRLPRIRQHEFRDWRRKIHTLDFVGEVVALRNARQTVEEARERAPGTNYECTAVSILAGYADDADVSDADVLLDDALRVCTAAHGTNDIRISSLRLKRAYRALADERNLDGRSDAEAALPALIAHGLDDQIAAAYIAIASAARRLGDGDWDEEALDRARRWSAYAFGDDHELTAQLRR